MRSVGVYAQSPIPPVLSIDHSTVKTFLQSESLLRTLQSGVCRVPYVRFHSGLVRLSRRCWSYWLDIVFMQTAPFTDAMSIVTAKVYMEAAVDLRITPVWGALIQAVSLWAPDSFVTVMSCLDVMFHQSYGGHYLPASSAAAAYKAAYYHHQHQQQVGVQTRRNSNGVIFVCSLILGYFCVLIIGAFTHEYTQWAMFWGVADVSSQRRVLGVTEL